MQALQSQKNCGSLTASEEEVALANIDAVFEFACRFVMRSLPGRIEETSAEHLQSGHAVSSQPRKPGDPALLPGPEGKPDTNSAHFERGMAVADVLFGSVSRTASTHATHNVRK
jgi:hypothetical protein